VAVNLSRSLCQHHNLIDLIEPVLKDTRLAPEGLELELTESVLIQDRERAVSMLRALSVSGIRISIDDFGVEYSSLSYLRQLPITTLKIDQSFVREVTSNRNDAAIVQTIITLARCLKLTVIAEGVETDAQAAFLRDQQCDELQGYYFYRPIPAEAMTGILRAEGGANG
jgi:EAL domain-containing protein (putative c-di-GMP-specific phosphodiesterase class I)